MASSTPSTSAARVAGFTKASRNTIRPRYRVGRQREIAPASACTVPLLVTHGVPAQAFEEQHGQVRLGTRVRWRERRMPAATSCAVRSVRSATASTHLLGAVGRQAEPEQWVQLDAPGGGGSHDGFGASLLITSRYSRRAGCARPARARRPGTTGHSSRMCNNHLCGSTIMLSARSIPANRLRTDGAHSAAPP